MVCGKASEIKKKSKAVKVIRRIDETEDIKLPYRDEEDLEGDLNLLEAYLIDRIEQLSGKLKSVKEAKDELEENENKEDPIDGMLEEV